MFHIEVWTGKEYGQGYTAHKWKIWDSNEVGLMANPQLIPFHLAD